MKQGSGRTKTHPTWMSQGTISWRKPLKKKSFRRHVEVSTRGQHCWTWRETLGSFAAHKDAKWGQLLERRNHSPDRRLSPEKQLRTSLNGEDLSKIRVSDVRAQTRILENRARIERNLTLRQLEDASMKLTQKKAPGPDGIADEILKHLGPRTKPTLLLIFSQS